jgi:branched-chain amino acid transport system substrate-binding protein
VSREFINDTAGRPRRRLRSTIILFAAAILLVVTGCSGSSKGSTGSPSTGSKSSKTYKIGILTDISGPSASLGKNILAAIKAGVGEASAAGYKIDYVTADTQSTPSGAATAAQKLVAQEHVFAVIAISNLTFGAAPYLAAQGVPVFGGAVDGSEWTKTRNMFSVFGYPDYTKVVTTMAQFFKLIGATNVGAVGYGTVPSAALSTKQLGIAAAAAGLKVGYLNSEFPLGSTNVAPVVLSMKSAGVNGAVFLMQQNSALATIRGLRQQNAPLTAPLLTGGYGSDLLLAGPGSIRDGQNAYFSLSYEPVEMHTAATERFQSALKQYASFTDPPGFLEYLAYISVDAFVTGLKKAGPNPTRSSFITSMLGVSDYDAAGLFGSHTMAFSMESRGQGGTGADNCTWFTKFEGQSFKLVPGADPLCGTVIPGRTVS